MSEAAKLAFIVDEFLTASANGSKRLTRLVQSLTELAEAKKARLLFLMSGTLQTRVVYPGLGPTELASETDWKFWDIGHARNCLVGDTILVAVPRSRADILTGEKLHFLLLLEEANSSASLSRTLRQKASILLRDTLVSESERRLLDAERRLHALQNRLESVTDLCYRIVREIRNLIRFDHRCAIVELIPSEKIFRPVAILDRRLKGRRWEGQRELGFQLSRSDLEALVAGGVEESSPGSDDVQRFRDGYLCTAGSESVDGCLAIARGPSGLMVVETPAQERQIVDQIMAEFREAEWITGSSSLLVPLAARRRLLGFLIVSVNASAGMSIDDAAITIDLARFTIPGLAREKAGEIASTLLERSSRLVPEKEVFDKNDAFINFLKVLKRQISEQTGADFVYLTVFDTISGEMLRESTVANVPDPDLWEEADDRELIHEILARNEMERHCEPPQNHCAKPSYLRENAIGHYFACALNPRVGGMDTEGRPAGVLLVGFRKPRQHPQLGTHSPPQIAFSRKEKEMIRRGARIIEDYLALHLRIEWQNKLAKSIQQIYKKIAEATSTSPDALKAILKGAKELTGATTGLLAVPSNTSHSLRILDSDGLPPDKENAEIEYGQGITGACAATRRPIRISDTREPGTWPPDIKPLRWIESSRSEIAVPIQSDMKLPLIGVLCLWSDKVRNAFGTQEEEGLVQLAGASFIALKEADTLIQLESFKDAAQAIQKAAEENDIFQAVIDQAAKLCGAFAANIRTLDIKGENLVVQCQTGISSGSPKSHPLSFGPQGYAYRRNRICLLSDTQDRSEMREKLGFDYTSDYPGVRCELAIPISWGSTTIGVLTIEHTQPGHLARYSDTLKALAFQAAFSLNKRRGQEQIELQARLRVLNEAKRLATYMNHSVKPHFREILELLEESRSTESNALLDRISEKCRAGIIAADESVLSLPNYEGPAERKRFMNLARPIFEKMRSTSPSTFDIRIDYGVAHDAYVEVRGALLEWCLERILENSRRHGATVVTVETKRKQEDLVIRLSDNGQGVPDDIVDLRELYAIDRPWKPSGSGHALPTCEYFLGIMRGSIYSEREKPKGLATVIQLPIMD